MLTVKQAAARTGISSYTLRYYDNEGLFPMLHRDENGRRLFSDSDLRAVKTVTELREMGFSIAQIRRWTAAGKLGADAANETRRELLEEQTAAARAELAAAAKRLAMLQSKAERYCAGAVKLVTAA